MQKFLISNRPCLILITASSFLLAACTPDNSVESSLQEVQSILTAGNTANEVRYQLTYEPDLPCNAQLQESWKDDDSNWQHTYRFDLTDIETNTFVQSKSGRRAIIYGGYKISSDGIKKIFKEIRINNIRFRASLNNKDQQLIISAMYTAIALCEEKYLFE